MPPVRRIGPEDDLVSIPPNSPASMTRTKIATQAESANQVFLETQKFDFPRLSVSQSVTSRSRPALTSPFPKCMYIWATTKQPSTRQREGRAFRSPRTQTRAQAHEIQPPRKPSQKRSSRLLIEALMFLIFLCPRNSLSRDSTPIASIACRPRLPIAASATVSRARTSTNSL